MICFPAARPNDIRQAGAARSNMVLFGPNSRYALFAMHTRFPLEDDGWAVRDAETEDEVTGGPALVAICLTKQEAEEAVQRLLRKS